MAGSLLRNQIRLPWEIGNLVVHASIARLLAIVLVQAAAVAAEPRDTEPQVPAADIRAQDSLWLISCRHLGCPDPEKQAAVEFEYYQRQPGGDWEPSTEDAFQAAGAAAETTQFFVHGNRIEWCEAFSGGSRVYRSLIRHAPHAGPVRFVIWSWPSSEICGPIRDVRIKAARTHAASYYLAVLLSRLPAEMPLGILGFSYGGRIACGALHATAGGSLGAWNLAGPHAAAENVRVVLLASASHTGWLLPGGYHFDCWERIDTMLNYYNPRDSVLHWYPKLDRRSRPQALGSRGICESCLGRYATRLEQFNAAAAIGRAHDLARYLSVPGIMDRAATQLLWLD